MRFCTLAGARTVTCAATAHTDTLDIDILFKVLVFNCLGAINGILALQGKIHIRIVLYVDTRLSVLCQVDFGMIQRQVNIGSLVFILTFQIHTNINAVAAGGQVGILDCQVNICTLAHLDDGFFIPCVSGIRGRFSLGAGIYIHALNHDFYIVAFGAIGLFRLFDIFHNGDGVSRCGLSRGAVLCVVARRICGSIRRCCFLFHIFFDRDGVSRCGFLCAIARVISGWRNIFRWRVAVLNVDRTIASFRFILVDVGAVLLTAVLTLITIRAASVILVNSYTAIAQIIRHRRSAGANRAHCNRGGQRHCCQLEFLVCHFSSAPFQFMLT